MNKKISLLCLLLLTGSISFGSQIPAAAEKQKSNPAAEPAKQVAPATKLPAHENITLDNVIFQSNQMMLALMDQMKNGNLKEARNIAIQMIEGNEKYLDTQKEVFRAFANNIEKKMFELELRKEGNNAKVVWVTQPIADGFYFLSIIDFTEKKFNESFENIQKAISWNPVRSAFHSERGFIILNQPDSLDLAMAMTSYMKAAETAYTKEDFATAMRGIGYVFIEKGDLEAAVSAYMISKRFDPQNTVADQEISFINTKKPDLSKSIDINAAAAILNKRGISPIVSKSHVAAILDIVNEIKVIAKKSEIVSLLKLAREIDPNNPEINNHLESFGK
ncbi:MAG: hypothetical protein HQM10_02940 [Candidatus Riflebacteria bacterium]|nr:hypothetical protein [Candidatus Riflebacteria bacterium]